MSPSLRPDCGRLDSTNIVTPELSIITNIGLEHQQFLGNTLEEITREKAGIIKHGRPVVVGRADGVVREVIEAEAKRLYAEVKFAQDNPEVLSSENVNGMLRLQTNHYGVIDCELTGDYQVENANTVLFAMGILKRLKYRIRLDAIKEGFANVVENTGLMGRWMKLGDSPRVICDSAHNPAGMEIAMRQLKREHYSQLHMIVGFMADKDVINMLKMLPANAKFYLTQAQTTRALPVKELKSLAAKCSIKGETYNNVAEALEAARKNAGPDDLIYVGGSMYVLAELLTSLGYGDQQEK